MKSIAFATRAILGLGLILFCSFINAEQKQSFGNYDIHYSAVNTGFLQPDIAKRYGIVRSKKKAFVNIAVRRKNNDDKNAKNGTKAVPAVLSGSTANLLGQTQQLEFQEIREANAIYYIATFPILDQEWLKFNIDVQPNRDKKPFHVFFKQQFYKD